MSKSKPPEQDCKSASAPSVSIVGSESTEVANATATGSGVADSLLGQTIGGHYKILSLLGHGGLGTAYLAQHLLLGARVVVKYLHQEKQHDAIAVARFRREAESTMGLRHPAIAAVQDFGTDKGAFYLVSEYVEGQTLESILQQETKLEPSRAFSILKQVAEALAIAHSKQIIHRDIKPSNIMICETRDQHGAEAVQGEASRRHEQVKVIDFGIAKALDEQSANLTQTGEIFGTPNYMSPEQCQGARVDCRSDIYSLGCVAYEMLSGKPPFVADSAIEVLMKHIHDKPVPLNSVPGYKELNNVIEIMLSKTPEHRYSSCAELSQDLDSTEQSRPIERKPVRRTKHRLTKFILAGLAMLLIAFVCLIMEFCGHDVEYFTRQIARDPGEAPNYLARGMLYQKAGLNRPAIADYSKYIELRPKDPFGYRRRAQAYRRTNEYQKSVADLDDAITLTNDDTVTQPAHRSDELLKIYIDRAVAERMLGNYDMAIADSTKSLELNPGNTDNNQVPAYLARAQAYYYTGRFKEALADLDKALPLADHVSKNGPGSERLGIWLLQAKIQLKLKNYSSAAAHAIMRLDEDPKSVEALVVRAQAYARLGHQNWALQDINEALTITSGDKELNDIRGRIISGNYSW